MTCLKCTPPPDVIKIDVEGAELDAIRGARTLLRTYSPAVLMEVNDARSEPLGGSPAIQELSTLGYRFFEASGSLETPSPLNLPLRYGHDVVALKS